MQGPIIKTILKQIMPALAALLLAAASGSAQVLSPVYSFNTNELVASTQTPGLLLSGNALYGTLFGRPYDPRGGDVPGSVFKLNTDGTGFTNLYAFSPLAELAPGVFTNADGANSAAQLVLSGNRLYGTTEEGGLNGEGTLFAVNADGTGFTNFHNFSADVGNSTNSDGAIPAAGLVLAGNMLYGTTSVGGSFGGGTVFAINTNGAGFTNLYNFSGAYFSRQLLKSSLVFSNNILYGTTSAGGSASNGTVFALNADGTGFTNLHSFSALVQGTNSDGAHPQAGLVLSGNTLYGTATEGGSGNSSDTTLAGTVFAVNADGTGFTNLHSFSGSDGADPVAGLILSGNVLYGTAQRGGSAQNDGVAFAINADGTGFSVLHTFTGGSANSSGRYTNATGYIPVGNMVLSGSALYGATENGGSNGIGTVFALDLAVAPPTILFTANPTNGIVRLAVQFNSPPVDAGGNPILYWNWNFGDGATNDPSQSPSHFYTNAGVFLPTLTCVNNNGDPVIGSGPAIAASLPPPIQFTANPMSGLPPLAVQFNSPGADAGSNTLVSWNWNFGDGTSNNPAQNPSHTYTNFGAYFPSLTCHNNNGDTLSGSGPDVVVINTILLNGGFETGTFTNWTRSGNYSGSAISTAPAYRHAGKYGAELAAAGTMGLLSQRLSTTPGASYVISYWLDSHSALTPSDFQMSWDGNVLLDQTNLGNIGWTNIQLTVTAAGTNSTLEFGYLTSGSSFGLDDVSVSLIQAPAIASISLSGANLVLNGTGGLSGRAYFVLTGTNAEEPLSQWTPLTTNVLGVDGNFIITATNGVNPDNPRQFYILQMQ